jgi:hypothetical protein
MQCCAVEYQEGTGTKHTAIEHALSDERSTNPANAGIAETSTPLSSSASVTLNSVGSKGSALCAIAFVPSIIALPIKVRNSTILLRGTAMQGEGAQKNRV